MVCLCFTLSNFSHIYGKVRLICAAFSCLYDSQCMYTGVAQIRRLCDSDVKLYLTAIKRNLNTADLSRMKYSCYHVLNQRFAQLDRFSDSI